MVVTVVLSETHAQVWRSPTLMTRSEAIAHLRA